MAGWLRSIGWCVWKFITTPFRPGFSADEYPDVKENDRWYSKEFTPAEGKIYDVAVAYATQLYQDAKDSLSVLDKKAEWIFGVGTVSISAAFLILKERQVGIGWELAFLLFAAWGILGALRARVPGEKPTGASIRDVLEQVEKSPDAKPWICASLQNAHVALVKLMEWKASAIAYACHSIFFAMVLLGLGAIFSGPVSPPPPQNYAVSQVPKGATVDQPGKVTHSASAGQAMAGQGWTWELVLRCGKAPEASGGRQ